MERYTFLPTGAEEAMENPGALATPEMIEAMETVDGQEKEMGHQEPASDLAPPSLRSRE